MTAGGGAGRRGPALGLAAALLLAAGPAPAQVLGGDLASARCVSAADRPELFGNPDLTELWNGVVGRGRVSFFIHLVADGEGNWIVFHDRRAEKCPWWSGPEHQKATEPRAVTAAPLTPLTLDPAEPTAQTCGPRNAIVAALKRRLRAGLTWVGRVGNGEPLATTLLELYTAPRGTWVFVLYRPYADEGEEACIRLNGQQGNYQK